MLLDAENCSCLLLFSLIFPCLLSVAQIGLRQGAAAVDDNGLSGHEAGFVAGQIADHESDVFRLPKTADRQAGCQSFQEGSRIVRAFFRGFSRDHRRVAVTRADDVRSDAVLDEFHGEASSESDECGLGDGIGHVPAVVDKAAGYGRDGHDSAILILHHVRNDALGNIPRSFNVDVDMKIQIAHIGLQERQILHDTGVVDENIDPAVLLDDFCDGIVDVRSVRDVGFESDLLSSKTSSGEFPLILSEYFFLYFSG